MDINWPEVLIGLVLSLIAGDQMKNLPKLSEKITVYAASRLKDKKMAEARQGEWLESLDQQPSDMGKFLHSCDNLMASWKMEFDHLLFFQWVGLITSFAVAQVWVMFVTMNPEPMGADIASIPLWIASLCFVLTILQLSVLRFNMGKNNVSWIGSSIVYIISSISFAISSHGSAQSFFCLTATVWLLIGIMSFKIIKQSEA